MPVGDFEGADCTHIWGWTCQPDDPSAKLGYGVFDGATLIAGGNANKPNVAATCPGNHGFNIPTPASLKNALSHTLSVTTTKTDGTGMILGGTPKTIAGNSCTVAIGPCNSSDICGHVTSAEGPNPVNLKDIVMELRNAEGAITQSVKTDVNGNFVFSNLASSVWYVSPAVGRKEAALPSYIGPRSPSTLSADFKIRGITQRVQFSDSEQGTLVLITTAPWTTAKAPDIYVGAPIHAISLVINNKDNFANLPYGSYYFTCWELRNLRYVKSDSRVIASGSPLTPQGPTLQEVCP